MKLSPAIVLVCLCAGFHVPTVCADPLPANKSERAVRFVVNDQERSRLSGGEQRIPITIELSRTPTDPVHVFVILDRTFPGHLVVPMAPSAASKTWKATVLLDPTSHPSTTKKSQRYRIDASFAQMEGTKLSRFLKRSVYVTTAAREDACNVAQSERRGSSTTAGGFFTPDEAQAADPVVLDEPIRETHLAGPHNPEGGTAYWWGVKQRIAQRWKQHRNRRGLRSPVKTIPQVHFRLYANGMAQAVYLEQSSGHRRIDEAALASVVESQPFPPFPPGITRCHLDVRIDLNNTR